MGFKYRIVVLLYLKVWHMIVLVAEPLHELVYLCTLDGLGAGEGVEAGVLGLVGGQQQQCYMNIATKTADSGYRFHR